MTPWPEPDCLALLAHILHTKCARVECEPSTLVESWSGLVLGIREYFSEMFVSSHIQH